MFDVIVFFFKQKSAYEMRISDWSSDVCSSDLRARRGAGAGMGASARGVGALPATDAGAARGLFAPARSAHGAGHRGPQRGGAQTLRGVAGAGRGPARRPDAGIAAGLRRGVGAPVSRYAAPEPVPTDVGEGKSESISL